MRNLLFAISCILTTICGTNEIAAQERVYKPFQTTVWVNTLYQNGFTNGEVSSSSISIPRALIILKGDVNQYFSYKVQASLIGTPLVDAFVTLKANKALQFQIGQQHIPFTLENPLWPMIMESVDYTEAVTKLSGIKDISGIGSMGRDVGVSLIGKMIPVSWGGVNHDFFSYNVGIYNGEGANSLDKDKKAAYIGRLEFWPLSKLVFSGSYYLGDWKDLSSNTIKQRIRYSFGMTFDSESWVIRSEFLKGLTDKVESNGGYVQVGRWLGWKTNNGSSQRIYPFFRYDCFQENLAYDILSEHYCFGVCYEPWNMIKFKLNFIHDRIGGYSATNWLKMMINFSI